MAIRHRDRRNGPGWAPALLLACCLSACPPVSVAADEGSLHPNLDKRWGVAVGVVHFQTDASMAKWTEGEQVDYVDLARLGVAESDTDFWARFSTRLGERWLLNFDYFGLDTAGARRVNFEFEFGDLVVPIGAFVESSLEMDFYVLSAGYSFYRSDRAEVGLGLGIHGVKLDYDMYAERQIGSIVTELGTEEDDFLAPLPNAALYGAYAFNERWLARAHAGWISLTYDDYDGELLSLSAQVSYLLTERVSLGVGYTVVDVEVDRDRGSRRYFYDLDLRGPRAFLSLGL